MKEAQDPGIRAVFAAMQHHLPIGLILLAAISSTAFSQDSDAPASSPQLPYQWRNVAMGGAGFVSGIIAHPGEENLIYARTDVGGIYRLSPDTGTWLPLLDWLPPTNASAMGVESLALDPRDPGIIHLLCGTPYWRGGTSILSSADYGKTWRSTDVSNLIRAHGNKWGRHTGERLAVDPNLGEILFCGSRENGLWKSTDSASTWEQVGTFPDSNATRNGNGICFVVFDPESGSPGSPTPTLYAGVSHPRGETWQEKDGSPRQSPDANLYQSNDGGASWIGLPPLPDVGKPEAMSNATFHPNRALVSNGKLIVTFQAETAGGGGIFRYDPTSRTWADITPGALGKDGKWTRRYDAYCGISLVPGNPPRMLASTFSVYQPQKDNTGRTLWGERIQLSTRGVEEDGTTWLDLFASDKARLDPHIAFAKGQNIHWGASAALDPFNPQRAFITSGNGIWATPNLQDALAPETESRAMWKFAVKGLEESVPMDVVSIPDGPLVSVIWDYAGFTNTNPAQYSETGMFRVCGGLNVRLASVGRGMKAGVLRLNSAGELCWSLDSGISWSALEKNGLPKAGTEANLALSADGKVILYTPSDHKVYRNEDPARQWPAARWSEVKDLAGASRPVADPVDPASFYSYLGKTGDLLHSTDAGKTFRPLARIGQWANRNIRCAPGRRQDIWIPWGTQGLGRHANGSFSKIPLANCTTIGFGRGRNPGDYPTLFIWGRPLKDDPEGVYRSTDEGRTWARVNDDQHQYGGLGNGGFVRGDMNVFGRVYISTAGRGIPYGTPE
jgi:xyloglucan-specific exo-beta-1,4-glucanase